MVGIVLISHSRSLAEGAADLAGQIAVGVRIRAAGGTIDGGLGTSTDLIAKAIADADAGDGVVLIPDLGSSVLSARSVLADIAEFAEAPDPPRVVLADAPFVEGAVAAAVAASGGLDLDAVAEAAQEARDVRKL
jgi:phosphoenolpyruvate---glycerone phosphotransferase subunit DhaM